MSKSMNKIEKLIARLCPDGVEFKELGEIAEIDTGTQLNKTAMFDSGKYPVLNGGINPSGRYDEYNTEADTIAISQGGASAGYVNFVCEKFWAGAHCFVVKPTPKDISNRFLYFILKQGQEKLMKAKLGAGIPGLNRSELQTFKIPIPPLAVQQEIVKILDSFTKLEAELEARKKQYEYYRDKLLTFDRQTDGVRWATLSEICLSITAGGDLPEKYLKGQTMPTKEFPYPIYSNGSEDKALYGYTDNYKIDNEAVTISARGTIGYHAIRSAKFTPIVRLITLIPNTETISAKFLNYALDITEIGHSGGSIPQLTVPNVKKIKIPVPTLAEQERIVAILDKFYALVNDISVGLPAELNARRKQYEYYRDKLLTFKPLEK